MLNWIQNKIKGDLKVLKIKAVTKERKKKK
jgi:hypothetical protein